jgi:hypothetical protein
MGRPGQATDDNIIWRMRFVCCITKATDTHSKYVTLIAFVRQQWLCERASMLSLYVRCLSGCGLCYSLHAHAMNLAGTNYLQILYRAHSYLWPVLRMVLDYETRAVIWKWKLFTIQNQTQNLYKTLYGNRSWLNFVCKIHWFLVYLTSLFSVAHVVWRTEVSWIVDCEMEITRNEAAAVCLKYCPSIGL